MTGVLARLNANRVCTISFTSRNSTAKSKPSGAARQLVTLLLLRQKKVTKEKATLPYRPSGTFGRSMKLGGCGTRSICYAATCSNSPRLFPNFIARPHRYRRGINYKYQSRTQKQRAKPGVRVAHTNTKNESEGATRLHTTPLLTLGPHIRHRVAQTGQG